MQKFLQSTTILMASCFIFASPVFAASPYTLDGSHISIMFIIPFCGILMSIAIGPLLFPKIWHHHYGKIAAFWAFILLIFLSFIFSIKNALYETIHIISVDYIPFIVILFALFTISGGVTVKGNLHSSARLNTGLLALGTLLASVIGTTGASMVLIRPLLRANDNRKYRVHTVVFFIFLVSNIGGSLTPLGDPPLFLGFLRGVDFFWTTKYLGLETLFLSVILLTLFYILDSYLQKKEPETMRRPDPTPDTALSVRGLRNIPLLMIAIGAIFMSASWQPDMVFTLYGTPIALQNITRDIILIGCGIVSLLITPRQNREANGFNWEPLKEVAILFAGIFICIIPVLALLKAGENGALAPLIALTAYPDGSPNPAMYFWMTGILSAFLDNAPTYLVFFNLAGGDPDVLMTTLAPILQAISGGAVFMGALTYIGNAPNFMVKAIAENNGVKMPSFFGYMLWSGLILLPCFILLTAVFFG